MDDEHDGRVQVTVQRGAAFGDTIGGGCFLLLAGLALLVAAAALFVYVGGAYAGLTLPGAP